MSRYQHLFFDLDRTLWDLDANSRETLLELISDYGLERSITDPGHLCDVFIRHSEKLWEAYRSGSVNKSFLRIERFRLSLASFGIHDYTLVKKLAADYIRKAPVKTHLIPGTLEVLEYLYPRYKLHILSNGFTEIQYIKLNNSNLSNYFSGVITSESAGTNKPKRKMFSHALKVTGADKPGSLMIGDDLEVDIVGAREFGIDQVYFNPKRMAHSEKISYEINALCELTGIL